MAEHSSGLASIGIDWKLIIAQMINFLILFFVLARFAFKPIVAMLEKREKTIRESLENAAAINDEKLRWEEKYTELKDEARQEARKIIGEAKNATEKMRQEVQKVIEQETKALIAQARLGAAAERTKVMAETKAQLAELVILASQRLGGKKSPAAIIEEVTREAQRASIR